MKGWLDLFSDFDIPTVVASLALVVSLIVMFFTARQVSLLVRQLRLDSLIKISDANREIISLGFDKPELWKTLYDSTDIADAKSAEERKRYLQLWFNHMHVIWKARNLGLLDRHEWSACKADMSDFLQIRSLKTHWEEVRNCYPKPFQKFLDSCLLKEREQDAVRIEINK